MNYRSARDEGRWRAPHVHQDADDEMGVQDVTDPSHTFTASNGRSITVEVRASDGADSGLPFAIVTDDGRVELSQRQLEFIAAVVNRALAFKRDLP